MAAAREPIEPVETEETGTSYGEERSAVSIALALAVTLLLMISAFVWFVIEFDPLTDDFVDQGAPAVATATPPAEN